MKFKMADRCTECGQYKQYSQGLCWQCYTTGDYEERNVMTRDEDKRWKCTDCGAVVLETELLMATSPFYDGDVLYGCPKCFATDGTTTLEEVCDEPGCTEQATCGFPVADEAFGGYRRTCGKHWREHEDKTPNAELCINHDA